MRIKKLLALSLIASMLMSPITSRAEENVSNYDTNNSSGSIRFAVTVEHTYMVTMPARVELVRNRESGDYEATYTIGVKADLLTRQKLKVAPTAYSNIELKYEGIGANSSSAITITQPVDTWTLAPTEANEIASDSSQYVEVTGSIFAPRSAFSHTGTYQTDLTFNFSLTRDPAQG